MTAIAAANPCAQPAQVVEVWDRLWVNQPTHIRDDELLARERASRRWRLLVERIKQTFGGIHGLRAIELGSGRGDLSTLLAREGARVTLLDSSGRALDQARGRFHRLGLSGTFRQGDLFESAAAPQAYDVALSSGVIEHFQGDTRTRAIRAHRSVLCDGGMAVISVPNAHCLPYRIWKAWSEIRKHWPYGYEKPYSRCELVRRGHTVGFDRVEVHGCGFRQALNDQLIPLFTGRRAKAINADSRLDNSMGLSLVFFGWNS